MPILLNLLVTLAGGLFTVASFVIACKIITNRRSFSKFEKLSNGMPVFDGQCWLGNHVSSFAVGKDNCRKMMEGHNKLGPYIGGLLGDQFVVSTTDLDLIKRIAIDEGHLNQDRVSLSLPMSEYVHSIMLLPGPQWKPVRRVFAPALKSNKFKTTNVLEEIEGSINKLIGHIERKLDQEQVSIQKDNEERKFDVDAIIHKYSLDLVFSCFYKQHELINFDGQCLWTNLIERFHSIQTSPWTRLSMIFPWFSRLVDRLMWNFHELGFARKKLLEFVKLQTKTSLEARRQMRAQPSCLRKQSQNDGNLEGKADYRRNLIDHVIDAFLDGQLTPVEYFSSSCFLLAAADKTASDNITHTIYLLSIHKQIQERLRASIIEEGMKSEYLAWVINESLRLLPPVPVGCSRTTSSRIELDGSDYVIPEGTFVVTNAFAIHRLKKYWGEDAEEFRPERWADASNHHSAQFLAFGAGPRGCLGREFALFTMKMLLAALLTRYKFEGTLRKDAYKFDAPSLVMTVPSSATKVTITRLDDNPRCK